MESNGFVNRSKRKPTILRNTRVATSGTDDIEDVVAPRRQVEVEPARGQVVAVTVVACWPQEVAQAELPAAQVRRHVDVALSLRWAVVDHDQQAPARLALPGEGEELIPGGVVAPGRPAVAQLPAAVAHLGPLERLQQLLVERPHRRVA